MAATGPDPQDELGPFWNAAREGRFVLPFCDACGRTHWHPRAFCPLCGGERVSWREASGLGTIYSVSVVRRADPPYALALVTLDEGPTMLTNIIGCPLDAVGIGDRVRASVSTPAGGTPAILFAPLEKE